MKKIFIIYLTFYLISCTTIEVLKEKGSENLISVSIYQSREDLKKRKPGPYGILSEIYFFKNGKWEKIKSSIVPAYTLAGIKEGKYLIKLEKYISKEGHIEDLKGKKNKIINIKKGEMANVNVILKSSASIGFIIVTILFTFAILWAIYEILKEGDIYFPAPFEIYPDLFFNIYINIPWYYYPDSYIDTTPPKIIANYPLHKDPNVSKKTHIFLNFSEPIKKIKRDTIQVIGEVSGNVKGNILYNSTMDILEFVPEKDFVPGEKVYVTVNCNDIMDLSGNAMKDKLTFYFTIK